MNGKMKKVFSILLTAIMMMAFSTAVSAQENNGQQPSKKQRMSREQMAEMQAKHIARQLALDDATSQKFIETFSAYQKEVWTLRPQGKQHGKKKSEMTDAEVEKSIKDQFDHSQKILTLRQEYYKKYSKFLTPKQIQRVYELEKQSMNRLSKRGRGNAAGRQNAPGRPQAGRPNGLGKGKHNGKFQRKPQTQEEKK
jgi:Spy/CpxP family protein refolding chaperone